MRKRFVACVALMVLAGSGGAAGPPDPSPQSGCNARPDLSRQSLCGYWEEYFDRVIGNSVVGYAYGLFWSGAPVAMGGRGVVGIGRGADVPSVPMTAGTRMHMASISKLITAVALLRELERRGMDIDQPFWPLVRDVFPDPVEPAQGIAQLTIRQLLSHTTGWPWGYVWSPRLANLRRLLSEPVPNPPGQYRYSNINYALARTVLEAISGRDYETQVREEILRPVGAERMALRVDSMSATHVYRMGQAVGRPLALDFRDEAGPYGWYGTVEEFGRVLEGVRTHRYLSPEWTRLMFEGSLGVGTRPTPAGPAYRHEGQWVMDGNLGVHTGFAILPGGWTGVLFINTNAGFSANEILLRGFSENVPVIFSDVARGADSGVVRVERPARAGVLRCTTDGSEPTRRSPRYTGPIRVALPASVRCAGFAGSRLMTFVTERQLVARANDR